MAYCYAPLKKQMLESWFGIRVLVKPDGSKPLRYRSGDTNGFGIGSYQDSKSGNTSYKVLSYRVYADKLGFAIYEINSNAWRILDVTPECGLIWYPVSLKGKTYWLASDDKEEQIGIFLVSFDYTTEIFECLLLPFGCPNDSYRCVALSSVREHKLSVLTRRKDTCVQEIWITSKIDEIKVVVSWSKFLTVDCPKRVGWTMLSCFLVDEENKESIICYGKGSFDRNAKNDTLAYIFGEDNKVAQLDFGVNGMVLSWPVFLNYVPSLVQIGLAGGKRKRGD